MLHNAIPYFRNILFSNNLKVKSEALKKGWEFKFVERFTPISNDFLESRLQGKYTKFLQFLVDFPELRSYEYIVHIDHKNVISYEEIKRLKSLFLPNKKIFMISSADLYSVIKGFNNACKTFDSYSYSESRTREWIQKQVSLGIASWEGQEYATSFIMYKNYESLLPFLKEVYDTCFYLKQPYCQAIWAVMIQSNLEKINLQSIHWTETDMYRKTPLPFLDDLLRILRSFLKKFLSSLIQFLGFDYEKFRKKYIVKIFGASIK